MPECGSTFRDRESRPTTRTWNRFPGILRASCGGLDAHWFTTLAEAKQIIEAWRQEYNESRPHRAHGERMPHEIVQHKLPEARSARDTEKGDRSKALMSYYDLRGKWGQVMTHIQRKSWRVL